MVKLFCAVVGVGSVFSVDIELSETVDDLKDKIKEKMPSLIHFDAALLKLYLAKRGSSWLNIGSNDIKAVQRRETPDTIKVLMKTRMNEARTLENRAYLGAGFTRVDDDIHILVELPAEPDEVVKYNQLGGSLGSLLDNVFSLQSPWSYLQSLFGMDKASQTKKDV